MCTGTNFAHDNQLETEALGRQKIKNKKFLHCSNVYFFFHHKCTSILGSKIIGLTNRKNFQVILQLGVTKKWTAITIRLTESLCNCWWVQLARMRKNNSLTRYPSRWLLDGFIFQSKSALSASRRQASCIMTRILYTCIWGEIEKM